MHDGRGMEITTSIVETAPRGEVSGTEPVIAAGDAGADATDLRQRAKAQEFSAAWSDEWNPNPLSDVTP